MQKYKKKVLKNTKIQNKLCKKKFAKNTKIMKIVRLFIRAVAKPKRSGD